jgi:hypothetical protein
VPGSILNRNTILVTNILFNHTKLSGYGELLAVQL